MGHRGQRTGKQERTTILENNLRLSFARGWTITHTAQFFKLHTRTVEKYFSNFVHEGTPRYARTSKYQHFDIEALDAS